MTILLWSGFIVFVLAMLALDLGVLRKEARLLSTQEALRWTGVCILLALLFNVFVYFLYEYRWFDVQSSLGGTEAAQQFFVAWLVEQSLSLDNVFVFALVFSYFRVPLHYQHRVLFWGIVGALIMRGVMIALGAALFAQFSWTEYLFGALLLYAAFKMMFTSEGDFNPEGNVLFKIARKVYPVSPSFDGQRFFTTLPDGRRAFTPLFLVLLVIESSDVLFAVDSIPAVFAITAEPFIVFTSNIFAILNLRSLYFALSALMNKFTRLRHALVFVLVYVAFKMLLSHYIHFPTWLSLLIIVLVLGLGVLASVVFPVKARELEVVPPR